MMCSCTCSYWWGKTVALRLLAAAAVFGTIISAVLSAAPVTAVADGSTVYVNSGTSGAACSDTLADAGSQAEPFCTVQAGVDAAQPGQTVMVESGYYRSPVTMTNSGSPGDPITITGALLGSSMESVLTGDGDIAGDELPAITFNGVHDVVVRNLWASTLGPGFDVKDSSRVTLENNQIEAPLSPDGISVTQPGVIIEGQSSDVTVSSNQILDYDTGVAVDPGAQGTVVTTNLFDRNTGAGLVATGAAGTVVTSNTFRDNCGPGITLLQGSTGSTLENNILYSDATETPALACQPSGTAELNVSADSAPQTTEAYDLIDPNSGIAPYTWSGTRYSSPAQLQAATGQGAHDIQADPLLPTQDAGTLSEGSPAINSADANAPGELATDINGDPRVDDPLVPSTGTGPGDYDRGAFQFQNPYSVLPTVSVAKGFAPVTVTVTAVEHNPWHTPITSYTFDFGDGTAPQVSTSPTVTHTFTSPSTSNSSLSDDVGVSATEADGTVVHSTFGTQVEVQGTTGTYHSVAPSRLLDTRTTGALVPAGGTRSVRIEGNTKIPGVPASGVTAVVLNLTATATKGSGYLTAYAAGTTRPATSNLNWTGNDATTANQVTVPVGANGTVDLYTSGATAILADIQGYYTDNSIGATYTSVTPARILDTRSADGISTRTAITNNTINLAVRGHGGIPANAADVLVNLTAVDTGTVGYLAAYPQGTTANVSNLNWTSRNATRSGLAVVPIAADGDISIKVSGTAQVLADVSGYFTNDDTGAQLTTITPARVLDTRKAIGVTTTTPLTGGHILTLSVAGNNGIPYNATAVILNITVTGGTSKAGYLTAWASGLPRPNTSNLDWTNTGATVPNAVIVPLGLYNDDIDLYVSGTTHVIADISGYYTN